MDLTHLHAIAPGFAPGSAPQYLSPCPSSFQSASALPKLSIFTSSTIHQIKPNQMKILTNQSKIAPPPIPNLSTLPVLCTVCRPK